MNRYQLSKPAPTINSFQRLKKKLDDENNNIRVEKIVKPSLLFVARINHFSSLSQQLKEVVSDEYEIKIMNEQIKIQRSSIVYVSIVKGLKSRNMEIHTYKPKQEKSFKVVLKHIHSVTCHSHMSHSHVTVNLDDIKKEIEDLGHSVINIWNICQETRHKKSSHILCRAKAEKQQ